MKKSDAKTNLLYKLTILNEKLMVLKSKESKKRYLTTKEIREHLLKGETIPTNIFTAKKTDYIVKPRTIYGPVLKKTRKFNK